MFSVISSFRPVVARELEEQKQKKSADRNKSA